MTIASTPAEATPTASSPHPMSVAMALDIGDLTANADRVLASATWHRDDCTIGHTVHRGHATFVERVWFEEAFTSQSRAVLGIEEGSEESFVLDQHDTIESVRTTYRAECRRSREAMTGLTLDDEVAGNRRGSLPLRWILLHMLRELAQHRGHADILREQILAAAHR